ncbi:hypothetical protein CEXT_375451 [Caerostris extrusa]|uniref:Sodium/calcium exchanger membrane region domain-containing protein n=1 Tax=Caerostris extrusa TaxID=172846 RepID=A0AAV4WRL4_CAEEX|nr:hypothetical protein CEXT_375451 [Caerostris extrusa]
MFISYTLIGRLQLYREPSGRDDQRERGQRPTAVRNLGRAALTVNGGDIENATTMDYVLHFLTFGWKLVFQQTVIEEFSILIHFAKNISPYSLLFHQLTLWRMVDILCIPGVNWHLDGYCWRFGEHLWMPGWAEDAVTAITFVALGTSLPDLFASMAAAKQGRSMQTVPLGQVFKVPAGTLGFSVGIYTALALACIALIVARRYLAPFGSAELGGPRKTALICAAAMICMWFLYIILSSLEAYKYIRV